MSDETGRKVLAVILGVVLTALLAGGTISIVIGDEYPILFTLAGIFGALILGGIFAIYRALYVLYKGNF